MVYATCEKPGVMTDVLRCRHAGTLARYLARNGFEETFLLLGYIKIFTIK